MKRFLSIVAALLIGLNSFSQNINDVIKKVPKRLVNDHVKLLSADEKKTLESKLVDFDKKTSTQIAVVLVKSLQGRTIEEVSNKLFNKWGIGQKDKNNGLLILAAINDRKVRIEVGTGLESVITNEEAANIIQTDIVPNFKEARYYHGLDAATDALMSLAKQEFPDTTEAATEAAMASSLQQNNNTNSPAYAQDFNPYKKETSFGRIVFYAILGVIVFIFFLAILGIKYDKNGALITNNGYNSGYGGNGGGFLSGLFWGGRNRRYYNDNRSWNNYGGGFGRRSGGSSSSDDSGGSSGFGGFGGGNSGGSSGGGGGSYGGGSSSGGGASGSW